MIVTGLFMVVVPPGYGREADRYAPADRFGNVGRSESDAGRSHGAHIALTPVRSALPSR